MSEETKHLTPFDVAKTINLKSGRLIVDNKFNVFITNKLFSNTPDSIVYANYANQLRSSIDPQMVYDFYYYGLPKSSKRYGKWNKTSSDFDEDIIEYVQSYLNYSRSKAIDALMMFDENTLKEIKIEMKIINGELK